MNHKIKAGNIRNLDMGTRIMIRKIHNKVTFGKYKKQRYHYRENNNVNTRNDHKERYQYQDNDKKNSQKGDFQEI